MGTLKQTESDRWTFKYMDVGNICKLFTQTPGPGAYSWGSPDVYRYRSPIYSITARNSIPGDSTMKPGPGAHSPEKVTIKKLYRLPTT